MSYDLTQRQKKIQVHRAIKKIINNTFIPGVLKELDNSIKNLRNRRRPFKRVKRHDKKLFNR